MIRLYPNPRLPSLRHGAAALLLATLQVLAVAQPPPGAAPPASAASAPATTVRAEVGKPLRAAQEAIRAGNFSDALARVAEAEAMPNLTPYESLVVLRLKAAAAYGTGDLRWRSRASKAYWRRHWSSATSAGR